MERSFSALQIDRLISLLANHFVVSP